VLAFDHQGQAPAAEGIRVHQSRKSSRRNLAIEDASGDRSSSPGARSSLPRVRVGLDRGAKETHGARLYPVLSEDILSEECVIREASDAGTTSPSENIIVRRNRGERNCGRH